MQVSRVAAGQLLYSQLVLYATILACILAAPDSLSANTGLSYFGVHFRTVFIWGVGMIACAYLIMAAVKLIKYQNPIVGLGFGLIGPLMIGIVFTPYSASQWLDWLHTAFGSLLFIIQLAGSIWLLSKLPSLQNYLLVFLEFGAGVVCLIYLAPSQGFLLQAQIVFQAAFSGLLILNLILPARRI
jgi:hypothetical protein